MKKLLRQLLALGTLFMMSGCNTKLFTPEDQLSKYVANKNNYINHYNKETFEVFTSEDIEDVALYLPKETTTIRVNMSVANIEDVIYMKIVDSSGFAIDKVLRRVEDINELGLEQDGFMYEPSIMKNIVLLQLYVPSLYLYKNIYRPKLVFSFKRNSRSVQESINLYMMHEQYSVTTENEKKHEKPIYSNVKEYCAAMNPINPEFKKQLESLNTQRVDAEFLSEIQSLCK